ncbi:dynein axonemal assembly factor 11-like isoform X2 [Portunus trituberculatus]|uniref:dynein axonemal assembly factor 11-like isoform X2 n=1 Tax=Portunus trituberculatus TaxID=210409 RepID=UPI001E1CE1E5|nr:dynein axonemal assembly factor 11-like isoform X2 [Portunus trituberculatus]
MVRITLDLVRKRAEHNEGQVSTLEELSLHQQDIEKIEYLHRWCPRLRILYLQGNLISKIENVGRLRDLEYLNLALNNLERVEGLGRCESLRKLDLTANFIIDLTSLMSLQDLPCLAELHMTGNPCTSYRGYRAWVICVLPGLEELDGTRVTRSERLRVLQEFSEAAATVAVDQERAMEKRAKERESCECEVENSAEEDEEDNEKWWKGASSHTPETRLAMHQRLTRQRDRQSTSSTLHNDVRKRREVRLFTDDGRPLNVNAAKLTFQLTEDEESNCFVLEVNTYRHLDASLVTCDVEPWYVRITVKEKVLQLVMMEEVRPGQATAQRSQVTGHLVVKMPKLAPPRFPSFASNPEKIMPVTRSSTFSSSTSAFVRPSSPEPRETSKQKEQQSSHSNYLEVTERKSSVDYTNIFSTNASTGSVRSGQCCETRRSAVPVRPISPNFVDDPSVPPLE